MNLEKNLIGGVIEMFFFQNRTHNKDKNPLLNLNTQRILCGLLVEVENGKIVCVKGDPDCSLNRGTICAKGLKL